MRSPILPHSNPEKYGVHQGNNSKPSSFDKPFVTEYSCIMNKREKLLTKAQRAPNSLLFDELEVLLKQQGWEFDRQKGSHRIWISPGKTVVPLQPDGKHAKGYQVKQVLLIMEREKEPF